MLLLIAGFVIVALPDDNVRLFFSKGHGPSLQDAIGLLLVLIAYAMLLAKGWGQKHKLLRYRRSPGLPVLLFLAAFGAVLLIVSVANDYGWWWVVCAVILVVVQAIVFYLLFRKDQS